MTRNPHWKNQARRAIGVYVLLLDLPGTEKDGRDIKLPEREKAEPESAPITLNQVGLWQVSDNPQRF